jgi:hypothetical protein
VGSVRYLGAQAGQVVFGRQAIANHLQDTACTSRHSGSAQRNPARLAPECGDEQFGGGLKPAFLRLRSIRWRTRSDVVIVVILISIVYQQLLKAIRDFSKQVRVLPKCPSAHSARFVVNLRVDPLEVRLQL